MTRRASFVGTTRRSLRVPKRRTAQHSIAWLHHLWDLSQQQELGLTVEDLARGAGVDEAPLHADPYFRPQDRAQQLQKLLEASASSDDESGMTRIRRLFVQAKDHRFETEIDELRRLAQVSPSMAQHARNDVYLDKAHRPSKIAELKMACPRKPKEASIAYAQRFNVDALNAYQMRADPKINPTMRAAEVRALVDGFPREPDDTNTTYACRLAVHAANHSFPLTVRELAEFSGASIEELWFHPYINQRMRAANVAALVATFPARTSRGYNCAHARRFTLPYASTPV
jgi:hypothetical protein